MINLVSYMISVLLIFASQSATLIAADQIRIGPTVADFAYGSDVRHRLDLWQAKSDHPTPVVIMIHGGGWIQNDKSVYDEGWARPFLDEGISVVTVSYRLIQDAMEQKIEPPVKAPLLDCARAVQTVRWKAKEWNIDPTRVGATGSSAGAFTCLWLALHDNLANPNSHDPIARQSTHFACVAGYRAQTTLDPLEFRQWIPNADYGGHAFGYYAPERSFMESFEMLLANREKMLPWIMEYSPVKLVTKDAPPIFLDYPNQTTLPIVGQPGPAPAHSAINGIQLAERLKRVGTEIIISYQGHEDPTYGSVNKFLVAKLKKD
jgi:acetyl esterase/lipase